MFCEHCGARVTPDMLHCPVCGYRLRSESGVLTMPTARGLAAADQRRLPTWLWVSGVVLLFLVLLAGIVGLGALGVYQGLQERTRLVHQAAREHYDRGTALADQGALELALAEFNEAIRLAPDFTAAQEKAREVQDRLSGQAAPTIPPEFQSADTLLQSAQAADARGDLDDAIRWLQEMRDLYPQYRQAEVADLLYSVAYRRGLQLVAEDKLDEAIGRFDDALTARPNDPTALTQRRLAELYLVGLRSGGQGWDQIIANWEAVYRMQPDYKDVAERLASAYVGQGDDLAGRNLWCDARAPYQRAAEITPTPQIRAKLDDAREQCAQALPPVEPTPTRPRVATPSQQRFIGQLAGSFDIPGNRMHVRGRVVDRQGRGVAGAAVRISAFDWSAVATTDGNGNYSFDGLANPLAYTLTLINLPAQPIEVKTEWGKRMMVNFVEQR
jgi:tetratricopeptide (TPR) repeat protein